MFCVVESHGILCGFCLARGSVWALCVVALLGARDSVLVLDFGDVGFKKESLLVFVSFLGKRSLFGSLAKIKMAIFWGIAFQVQRLAF